MRSWVPFPISSISSRALTLNSIRRPSTLVTTASAVTRWPAGVAARWRIFTAVPTALSPGSRNSRTALSAAFSIAVTIIGVANTGGSAASLNWFARCAGATRSVYMPLAPTGIVRIVSGFHAGNVIDRRRKDNQQHSAQGKRQKRHAGDSAQIPYQTANDGHDHRAGIAYCEHGGRHAMHVVGRTEQRRQGKHENEDRRRGTTLQCR